MFCIIFTMMISTLFPIHHAFPTDTTIIIFIRSAWFVHGDTPNCADDIFLHLEPEFVRKHLRMFWHIVVRVDAVNEQFVQPAALCGSVSFRKIPSGTEFMEGTLALIEALG